MKTKFILPLLLIGFAVSAAAAVSGAFTQAEVAFAGFLNPDRSLNYIMRFFTAIGESPGVIGVIAMLLIIPATRRRVAVPAAVTVICSWLANTGIKELIGRARPDDRLLQITGYSFPSGHAMNSTALYLAVMLAALPICRTRLQRIAVLAVCIVLPACIGLSRVYFNVHYISDVLGGWCLGAAFAIIGNMIFVRLEKKRQ